MATTFFRFIPTGTKGNMFIFAQQDNKVAFFFMNTSGKHLQKTYPFHTEKFYKMALRTWGKEENILSADLAVKAEKILIKHPDFKPDQKAVITKAQVKTDNKDKVVTEVLKIKSAGNTIGLAFEKAGYGRP